MTSIARPSTGLWRQEFVECLRTGLTPWQAYRQVAAKHGLATSTVYRALDADAAARHRATKVASNDDYNRGRRRVYALRKAKRLYERNYRRLTRTPSQRRLLIDIFNWPNQPDRAYTLEQLTAELRPRLENQPFTESTVAKALHRYAIQARAPPYLSRANDGRYRLSDRPPTSAT